jgi:PAS domain S-box-containing protein
MKKKPVQLPETTELRLQAEERLKKQAIAAPSGLQTTEQLLHELQVHQIELEMQNEELRRTRRELEVSQARYFDFFDLAPVGFVMLSEKGFILEANLTAAKQLGVTRNALVKQPLTHFILPEDQDICYRQLTQLFEREAPQVCELRMLRAGVEPFWARMDATVMQDAEGTMICRAVVADITERKQAETRLQRVNRALRALNECNQVLVHIDNEAEFLQKMCEIIVKTGEYRLAWVGFADQDQARSVRPVAQSGFEDDYLNQAQITWANNERGRGPTGTAIREGMIQVNQNFLTNPKMEPWRASALSRGYQSSIALPLKDDDFTFGALTIYSATPDAFDAEEVNLLTELANDLAFGITTLRVRAESKRAEAAVRQLSSIVEQTEDTVVVTDRKGVIEYVNPAFERHTGYARVETLSKTPRILKSGIHDNQFYKKLWKTILAGDVFLTEIANRKKNGELYYEVKTITPLRDAQNNITHFVATGKDITEHKRDEEKLRKAYDELELRVQERTEELRIAISELENEITERKRAEAELRGANEELTRFNKAMIGRELRMIELKKEVNELCRQAGQPPHYSLDFEKEIQ